MITIPVTLTQGLLKRATAFSEFRKKCKEYLANNGIVRDKFTITPYDSFLGYVSEDILANYIRNKYRGNACVSRWQDQFDMDLIRHIVKSGRVEAGDVDLICSYFYDAFDLYISTPNLQVFINLKIDVKTAITQKRPQENWEFLYPVVQANKMGKDAAVLIYYIVEKRDDPKSLKELVLAGYINENDISKCDTIGPGELTSHNTLSQTDNYITYVKDYHELNELFKDLTI